MDPLLQKNLIGTQEASRISGYTADYLARLAKSGKISGVRIGRNWFVDRDSLERFANAQGTQNADRARALAQARAEEYRASRSLVRKATRTLADVSAPLQKMAPVKSVFRSQAFALSLAFCVVISGAVVAKAAPLPEIARGVEALAREVAFGFEHSFGALPGKFVARIAAEKSAVLAHHARVNEPRAFVAAVDLEDALTPSLAYTEYGPETFTLARIEREAAHKKITISDVESSLMAAAKLAREPRALSRAAARSLVRAYLGAGELSYGLIENAFDAYAAFIDASGEASLSLGVAARDTLVRVPDAASAASDALIETQVRLVYGLAAAGPESAQLAVGLIGETGSTLAGAAAVAPQLAATAYWEVAEAPSRLAPIAAEAVFEAEYAGALKAVAVANSVAGSAGQAAALAAAGGKRLVALTGLDLDPVIARVEAEMLGFIGSGVVSIDEAFTAAVASANTNLSLGEEVAISVYRTVNGLFGSARDSFASLFAPKEAPAIVVNATASSTPTVTHVTAYPTYTTVTQGVTEAYVNAAIATTRGELTNALMAAVTPLQNQIGTNINTIASVARIESLGSLTVTDGTFDRGTIRNMTSVGATTGTFTNLNGTTLSISGNATISGDLSITGSFTPASISSNSAVSAPYFTATSTTATSSFSGALTVANRLGIGTTTPAVTLDIYATDAIRLPIGTTAQRPSGDVGFIPYNTSTSQFEGYGATGVWQGLGGLIDADQDTYVTADTNNADEDYLRFFTAGSQRMTITNSGLIGIGTTTPGAKLQVAIDDTGGAAPLEALRLSMTSISAAGDGPYMSFFYNNASEIGRIAGIHDVSGSTNGALTFYTNNGGSMGERVRIDNDGNVGIGTTTPYGKFAITSGSPGAGARAYSGYDDLIIENSAQVGISLLSPDGYDGDINFGSPSQQFIATIRASYNAGSEFLSFSTVDTERVRITDTGTIGIGTTSPWGLLSLTNTGTGPSFIVEDSTSPDSSPFIIDASGNVGIGTASPGEKLDVAGSGATRIRVSDTSSSGVARLVAFGANGYLGNTSSTGSLIFQTNSTDRALIDSSGNFGIGTTSPWGQLSVNPNGVSGPSFVVGSSTATNFIVTNGGDVGIGTVSPNKTGLGTVFTTNTATASNYSALELSTADTLRAYFAANNGGVFLNTNGALPLTLQTNSTDRITLLAAGNIGIASSSPWGLLSVNPNGIGSGVPEFVVGSTTGTHFMVDGTGNVGINNTNPDTALGSLSFARTLTLVSPSNAASAGGILIGQVGTTNGFNAGQIAFGSTANTASDKRSAFILSTFTASNATTPSGDLQFWTANAGAPTVKATITSGGSLSVGTSTSPSAMLQVSKYSPGSAVNLMIQNTDTSTNGSSDARLTLQVGNSGAGSPMIVMGGPSISQFVMGLDRADSNKFKISNGTDFSTNWLTINTSSGNVGIGTTSPAALLSVAGTGYFTSSIGIGKATPSEELDIASANPAIRWTDTTDLGGATMIYDSDRVDLYVNSASPFLTVNESGNVGIGTTTPGASLSVVKTGSATIGGPPTGTWAGIIVNNNDIAAYNGLSVQNRWASTGSTIFEAAAGWNGASVAYVPVFTINGLGHITAKTQGSGGESTTAFQFQNSSGTTVLSVDTTNLRVGIGNTSPDAKLTVGDDPTAGDANFTSVVASGGVSALFSDNTNSSLWIKHPSSGVANFNADAGGQFTFSDGDVENVRINGSGNIGIGTASPQNHMIHIATTSAGAMTNGILLHNRSDTANTGIGLNFITSGNDFSDQRYNSIASLNTGSGTALTFSLSNGAAPTERMRIVSSTGYVGVGTTSPATTFSVAGNGYLTGGLGVGILNTTSGKIAASGDITWGDGTGTLTASGGNAYVQATGSLILRYSNGTQGAVLSTGGNLLVSGDAATETARFTARRTSGTTEAIGFFEAAIGSFTGTSLKVANTLGAASTYNLFEAVTDSDGDAGGETMQFIIRGDGNVGIGTSTPSIFKTTIRQNANNLVGGLAIQENGNSGDGIILGTIDGTRGFIGYSTELSAGLSAAAEVISITSSSRVGIGSTNPTEGKLVVGQSSASNAGIYVGMPTASVNTTGGVRIQGYSPSLELIDKDSVQNWYLGINDDDSNKLYIGRGYGPNQAITPVFAADASDNVGIGTASPGKKLDVSGTGRFSSTLTLSNILSCTSGQALQTNGSGDIACGTVTGSGVTTAGGWTSTNSTQAVTLATTTYRVAVGATSTPYAKFTVQSDAVATTTLALVAYSSQTANILDLYNSSGTHSSAITAGGFWGLGNTSPSVRLVVQGTSDGGGNTQAMQIRNGYLNILDRGDGFGAAFRMTGNNAGTASIWDFYSELSTGDLRFYQVTNSGGSAVGADRLLLDNTGRVGVGSTSTPWALFSINPNALGSGVPEFVIGSTTDTHFLVNGTGQVGIGTTNTTGTSKLYIASTDTWLNFRDTDATADNKEWRIRSLNGKFTIDAVNDADSASVTAMDIGRSGASSITNVTFPNGLIGIGTTSPWGKLSVTNTGTGPSFVVEDATSPDSTPFLIDASGNVGIGTASPGAPLTVSGANRAYIDWNETQTNTTFRWVVRNDNGSFNIEDSSSGTNPVRIEKNAPTGALYVKASTGNTGIGSTTPWGLLSVNPNGQGSGVPEFVIGSSTATHLLVDGAGFVGLSNITNPTAPLDVGGVGSAGALGYAFSGTDLVSGRRINLYSGNQDHVIGMGSGGIFFTGNTNIRFDYKQGTSASNGTTLLYLDMANSRVGIGTTSPASARLQVETTSGTGIGSYRTDSIQGTNFDALSFGKQNLSGQSAMIRYSYDTSAPYFSLFHNGDAQASGLTVKKGGNVGVGTTSPWAGFSVNPNALGSGVPEFVIGSTTATHLIVTGSGRLGVNTSAPTAGLDVNSGDAHISDALYVYSGTAGGGVFLGSSITDENVGIAKLSNESAPDTGYYTSFGGYTPSFGAELLLRGIDGIVLGVSRNGQSPAVRINSSSNVGVGTTSPSAKLTVWGTGTSGGAIANFVSSASTTVLTILDNGAAGFGTAAPTAGYFHISGKNLLVQGGVVAVQVGSAASPSYQFQTDGNSGIFQPTGSTIGFSTAATERMRLDGSGNLGVATTSTLTEKFTVYGSINARSQSNDFGAGGVRVFMDIVDGTKLARIGTVTGGDTLTGAQGEVALYAKGVETIRLNASAYVGIGTTTPSQKLTVSHAGHASTRIENTSNSNALALNAGTGGVGIEYSTDFYFTSRSYAAVGDGGGTAQMVIKQATGNVGIGTNSPGALLTVAGTASTTNLTISGITNSGGQCLQINSSGVVSGTGSACGGSGSTPGGSDGQIQYNSGGTFAGASALAYTSTTGRLNIGTTTSSFPSNRLTLVGYDGGVTSGNPTNETIFRVENNGAVGMSLVGASGSVSTIYFGSTAANGNTMGRILYGNNDTVASQYMALYTGNSERVRINGSGNFGIGSTSPWGLLSVNPNALGSGVPEFVVGSSTATRLIVTGGGNVGIGTTNPTRKLEVNGALGLSGNGSGVLYLKNTDDAWYIGHTASENVDFVGSGTGSRAWNFKDGSTLRASIRMSDGQGYFAGSVGIGTTSPSDVLDVAGNTNGTSGIHINNASTGGSAFSTLYLGNSAGLSDVVLFNNGSGNSASYGGARSGGIGTNSATPFVFITQGAEKMRITAGGNVGIASTSPWGLLSVNPNALGSGVPEFVIGSSTATHLIVTGAGNVGIGGSSPSEKIDVAGAGKFTASSQGFTSGSQGTLIDFDGTYHRIVGVNGSGGSSKPLAFGTGNSATQMVLLASGNFGVGTTTPNGLIVGTGTFLNVDGTTGGGLALHYTNATAYGELSLYKGNNGSYIDSAGSASVANSDLIFRTGRTASSFSPTEAMRIQASTGNIGIGTTTPWHALNVVGTIGSYYSATQTGGVVMYQDSGSTGYLGTESGGGWVNLISNGSVIASYNSTGFGVGTTSPWGKLSVTNTGTGPSFVVEDATSPDSTPFLIDASGNVGIGLSNPSYPIDVYGTSLSNISVRVRNGTSNDGTYSQFRAENSDGGTASLLMTSGNFLTSGAYFQAGGAVDVSGSGGLSLIAAHGSGAMRFATGGSADANIRMTITSAGNVGIGTTSPSTLLNIYNSSAAATLKIEGMATDSNAVAELWLSGSPGANKKEFRIQAVGGTHATEGNKLIFYDQTAAAYRMVIDNVGKVGIGTTTPVSTLSVQGSLCVRDTGSCGTTAGTIYATTAAITDIDLAENYETADPTLAAGELVAFATSTQATVKRAAPGDAVIGIVSTAPGVVLGKEIANSKPIALAGRVPVKVNMEGGTIEIGDRIALSSVAGVGKKATSSTRTVGIALEGATSDGTIEVFVKSEYTFMPNQLTIDETTGNVGIGTETPNYALEVAGEVAAISFVNTSTRDAKTDINYLSANETESMLDEVLQLKVATYRYRIEDQNDPLRLGLIAEDVQAVAPEILSPSGKGVDVYKLATYNIAATQALAAKVASFETRVTSLEDRIAALEAGAVSSGGGVLSLSTTSLASALESFGVLIKEGVAQFNTLVFRQLVASKDADGTSSAGSVVILSGNTVAQVNNSLVAPSTKIFVTFNAQIQGSWWVSDKADGSFRVVLSEAQAGDVSFDYFLVQTEGQIATSSPSGAYGVSQSSGPDIVAPVVTLLGDNPLHLSLGGTFVEPGVSVTDNAGSASYITFLDGVETPIGPGTIDTSSDRTYIITYYATDAAGNSASALRSVIVGTPAGASGGSSSGSSGSSSSDTTAPVVTLNGDAAMELAAGGTFTDPGATATDETDGDLSAGISVTGTVDTATPGLYTLTYSVTDAAGNTGSASRVVTVTE